MTKRGYAANMTPHGAALVGLLDRYVRALLDPFVTLLDAHKLMYFMKVGGEPALERLRVVKGPYGPYAENLTHVLREIDGYFISGHRDGGDAPDKELELVPGAVADAHGFLREHPATRARFERVADLVEGFESSFGLELLSTVHWVITRESSGNLDETVSRVHAWNDRKKRFSDGQIRLAAERLEKKGWLDAGAPRADR